MRPIPSLLALLLAAPFARAQAPAPAPEMQQLAPLVGSWKGAGEVVMAPDAEPLAWTSVSEVCWILGGHFLREDLRVDVDAEDVPGPLRFVTIYGWDARLGQPVVVGVANAGASGPATMRRIDEHTFVGVSAMMERGAPVSERWISRVEGDELTLRIDRASGDGPFYTHVRGRSKRFEGVLAGLREDASALEPRDEHLAFWEPTIGAHDSTGTWQRDPDSPEVELHGTASFAWALGGAALEGRFRDEGEGSPFEALSLTWWDPERQCFALFAANSAGESDLSEGRVLGPGLAVFTSSSVAGGTPGADRVTISFDEETGAMEVAVDRMQGDRPTHRSYTGRTTRRP